MKIDDPRIKPLGKSRGLPITKIKGMKVNMLVVIKCVGSVKGRSVWLCKCDCGNEVVYLGKKLASKQMISCGCQYNGGKEKLLTGYQRIIGMYKISARRRKLCWKLTEKQAETLFKSPCHYCGATNSNYLKEKDTRYNGIDRKDNTEGYILSNVVPCCKECNYLKNTNNYNEFVNRIKKISWHLQNRVACNRLRN